MERSVKHCDGMSNNIQHDAAGSGNTDYNKLYDDAWRSDDSDAASLQEVPIDYLDIERNDCDHTVNNAITEVSNEFLSGKIGASRQAKYGNSDESHSETEFKLVRGLAYVARYPESAAGMSDNDWNPYGTESDTNISPRVHFQNGLGPKLSASRKSSLPSFNPQLHSTDLNVNTPSAAIHSIRDYDSNAGSSNEQSESKTFFLLQPEISADFLSSSVTRQTKDLPKSLPESPVNNIDLNKTFRGANPATTSVYTKRPSYKSTVDYSLLQKELQDIQDNLHVLNPEMKLDLSGLDNTASRQSGEQTCVSSGSDCDIIPSTTITPDRHSNQMAWDYAADLGYQQPGGHIGDISLETFITNTHRPSGEKKCNSDGDETRTSDGSDRMIDQTAADQGMAEMSQILHPQMGNHRTAYNNVDEVLCNFENQRQQIESCYQQLNDPGLAEKVSRILSIQDPQSQASGILSEVTAQERQMRSQLIINPQRKDFNFSAALSDFNESSDSLAKPDNVRKRLDLSGLSSTEVSRLVDPSAVCVPARKEFAAFDDVARLLSSQMVKVSERTFNNSLEVVVPQRTVQCYPLTVDNKIQQRATDEKPIEEAEKISEYPSESMPNWSTEAGRSEHTSTPVEMYAAQNEQSSSLTQSHDDSDSSSSRRREKYRPYRPAGSKEVYYTESDVPSVADSATTLESTHLGSDDAQGPVLPPSVLGSRQDAPNVPGIYGTRKPLLKQHGDILPPIQEKSGLQDDRESEASKPRKDNMTLEIVHSHEKSPDVSSSFADQEFISGPKKNDNISRHENDSITNSRPSRSVEGREDWQTTSHYSESNPVTVGLSADGTSNGRWAKSRNQQDLHIYEQRTKGRDEIQNSETNNMSQLSVNDDLHAVSRQYQRPNDYYQRHAGMSLYSHHLGTLRQKVRTTQPVSLRSLTPYDEEIDRIDAGLKQANPQVAGSRGRSLYSTKDISAHSPSKLGSESDDRHFLNRYNNAEKPFSPQVLLSLPERGYREETRRTLHRSYSDEDLYTSGRDKHLSRKSHHPLPSDTRKATGPVSSHHAEESIRPSPLEWSNLHQTDTHRTHSPPPTFLARERGQAPRSYTASFRQPANPTRRNQDYSLLSRATSSQQNMEGMQQPSQVVNPVNRHVVTRGHVSPESDSAEYDHQPVSQRAHLLTQALAQETEQDVQPDIDSLWEQFKASNGSSETTLNTSSLEAVTDLILHPSPHLVTQCLKEREEHLIERQVRAEADREKRRAERLENRHVHHTSSEGEANVDYTALLSKKEEERMKRRAAKKKKGKSVNSNGAEVENCLDNLFTIAEDAGLEQSPNKCNSAQTSQSSNVLRQPHVIDPNMKKLRERISKQRQLIDKPTLKELQKIEKLKKLEHLLEAKKRNEISDQNLKKQLEEISSASTPVSDESQEVVGKLVESHNTTPLSDDSTTAKDSSTEMHAWKTQKEMRIKMKVKDTEQKNNYNSIQSNKYKSSSSARGVSQGEQLEAVSSESKLLKLVAEGILTAEEAYRIAVERESAIQEKSSHDPGHRNSLHDGMYDRQNSRLHKFISPYIRGDNLHLHTHKNHYVPKLKSAHSVYDVADSYPESWYEHDSQLDYTNNSGAADPQFSDIHFVNEYFPTKVSQKVQPGTGSREWSAHSAPSRSQFTRQDSLNYGNSPHRSLLTYSPVRHRNKTSPHRQQSPARHEQRISPSRSLSFSQRNKENSAKLWPAKKKSTRHGSARHEKTHISEKPVLKQKSPESGGIAWQIPLDVPQNKYKLSGARRTMPLQERKLLTNTLSKKAREQCLQIGDLEPLQGWQMRHVMDHNNWHKLDHPQGISNELWKHDALANKVNHRDVDPLMDRVQFILSKHSGNSSTEDERATLSDRPLSKMSLQEALLARKQGFISKCKERQKRLALAREHRKLQECLRLEREALFTDLQRMAAANLNAHPYSENLYQPKRRFFSKQEMKEITMKRYKKLPEVLQKQESVKKMELCQLNRLRADIFNRKIQREVLRKQSMRRR